MITRWNQKKYNKNGERKERKTGKLKAKAES